MSERDIARLHAIDMKTETEEAELGQAELDAAEDRGRSSVLNALVNEGRLELAPPERDWSRVEARLLQDLPMPAKKHVRARDGMTRAAFVVLAAAAAIGLLVRSRAEPAPVVTAPAPVTTSAPRVASALTGTEGVGEVTINGLLAKAGRELHADDMIIADHARAVLDRPGKVAWLVEAEDGVARARVTSAGDTLVLGLEDGSIEAQVTPVPVGEAFAVDIAPPGRDRLRVAVHGTHLRVARSGNRIVVDLSEGVVAIGVAPAEGITKGTEIHAPAHIELDATDLGTLKVERTGVRPPVPLAGHVPALADPVAPAPAANAPAAPRVPAHAAAPKAHRPAAPARETIAAAVRDCASVASRGRTNEVRVTVTSELELQVDANGTVTAALFTPPLVPELQTCAANAIYRTKLEETGTVTVPIEISY